jgi:hypothetical protein
VELIETLEQVLEELESIAEKAVHAAEKGGQTSSKSEHVAPVSARRSSGRALRHRSTESGAQPHDELDHAALEVDAGLSGSGGPDEGVVATISSTSRGSSRVSGQEIELRTRFQERAQGGIGR